MATEPTSAPHSLPPQSTSLPTPLAFFIPLPEDPHVIYSTYTLTPTRAIRGDHPIEHARRRLLAGNTSLTLVQSFLPSVHVASGSETLYIFRITSRDRVQECLGNMHAFSFNGLLGEH
jgi:hypothetical protein